VAVNRIGVPGVLADLERLNPPLSDAEYAAHVTDVVRGLGDAGGEHDVVAVYDRGRLTDAQYDAIAEARRMDETKTAGTDNDMA